MKREQELIGHELCSVCQISWKACEAIGTAAPDGSGGGLTTRVPDPEGRPPIFTVTRWFENVPDNCSLG